MSNQIFKVMKKLFFILLISLTTIDVSAQGSRWFAQLRNGNNSMTQKYGPELCRLRLFRVLPEVE